MNEKEFQEKGYITKPGVNYKDPEFIGDFIKRLVASNRKKARGKELKPKQAKVIYKPWHPSVVHYETISKIPNFKGGEDAANLIRAYRVNGHLDEHKKTIARNAFDLLPKHKTKFFVQDLKDSHANLHPGKAFDIKNLETSHIIQSFLKHL